MNRSRATAKESTARADTRRPIALRWSIPDADDSLRDTGISLIGRVPWSTHLSLFCDTEPDLLDAACAFFAPAQHAQEHCIWIVSEPLSVDGAIEALRAAVPGFETEQKAGRFEVLAAEDWYYETGQFDWQRVIRAWQTRVADAVANGLAGVRAFGNPLWRNEQRWRDIEEYEHALETSIAGLRIIVLCCYMTDQSHPEDILNVARTHQFVIARRSGDWQFLEVPGSEDARREIRCLNGDLAVLPDRFAKGELLTDRERVVLAQLLHGASSKQVARALGISPRTVDFHRANMMRKLGAHNTAELIGKVLRAR
jgi:DNA-binding CsgD family transcriptional regulator